METTVKLHDMFSYSNKILVVLLLLIIFIVVLFFIIRYLMNRPKKIEVIVPEKKDVNSIKRNYISKIDKLHSDLDNKTITSRKAYQELSSLIRNFVYEVTNIKVQSCTLKDIKKLNMPVLYELISEYYDPEFNKVSRGNILNSIDKTKEVINRWY